MAGIYVHIPFCKRACRYCDFHFSTSLKLKDELIQALLLEIVLQKDFLNQAPIQTIYFGGGTPSIIPPKDIEQILTTIARHHSIVNEPEITLEANPDDINTENLKAWQAMGINRLSLGIQSFFDNDLQYMNRVHSASQAHKAIQMIQQQNFKHITIDLIYGTPTLDNKMWQKNLEQLITYNIPHFSAYALTVEDKTPLHGLIKKQQLPVPQEAKMAEQFEILLNFASQNNYEQYEISNFCQQQQYSKHNLSYWQNKPYLGIGPSAHSYNLKYRQFNISNNYRYINAIKTQQIPAEIEHLTTAQKFNEYVLTHIRTQWGININELQKVFPINYLQHFGREVSNFEKQGLITQQAGNYILTHKGKLFADAIAMACFVV